MDVLTYTVLTDGPSDRRLIPVINWTLGQHTTRAIVGTWADLYIARPKPISLSERIAAAVGYFPAMMLFVQRDSEARPADERLEQIREASVGLAVPIVEVVTVRMQEAWFLFDEDAIRAASGNPRGTEALNMPPMASVEGLPDPKAALISLLRQASGLSGRHLRRFDHSRAAYRVSELIDDYSPLRTLPAFAAYEQRLVDRLALM